MFYLGSYTKNYDKINILTYRLLLLLDLRFDRDVLLALIRYKSSLYVFLLFRSLFTKNEITCQLKFLVCDLHIIQLFKPGHVFEDDHSVISEFRTYRVLTQIQDLELAEILQVSKFINISWNVISSKI